jgi:hypothetical protein
VGWKALITIPASACHGDVLEKIPSAALAVRDSFDHFVDRQHLRE